MVLRSGIIIPFQFRDTKKLLMIGVPEENRNLNIWDLKNVVRAAFGIYNFEFRNKKIGFNIPDELLLHYLAQRHDLTNFVIEISQALDDGHAKEMLSYEPSCSMAALKQHHVPLPQRSSESSAHDYVGGGAPCPTSQPNSPALAVCHEPADSPLEHTNNSSDRVSIADSTHKLRLTQVYEERTPESLTQSIDPMDIIPKAESESEADRAARAARYQMRQEQQHHQQQQAAVQAHVAMQHTLPPQQFFPNYTHSLLGGSVPSATSTPMNAPNTQQPPYTPGLMSRFRIYDAALDSYVMHPQCRCGAQKLINESPTPEPTNLCQQPNAIEAPSSASAVALPSCDDDEEQDAMKFRIDKAGSTNSADLPMPAYETCNPKMDYDTQDELPDSPHSQHHLQQPQPPPLPPLHHAEEERLQHEFMVQQQQQHHYLQQQQHLAMLQQQEQQQQHQQQHSLPIAPPSTNNIRQRKERMSKRQKELYVHFLQQHQFINDHRRNDPVLDPYWLKLANLLNAVPQGAVKHVTEWKQTFDNWRYRIFLYARYNSKLQDDEAQNPRNCKPLTRTDKQAYNIWIRNPDTAPPDLDKMRNVFINLEDTTQQD